MATTVIARVKRRTVATKAPINTQLLKERMAAQRAAHPVNAATATHRVVTANNAATRAIKAEAARSDLDNLLKSISQNDQDIDDAVDRNEAAYAKIEQILRDNNFTAHSNGVYLAEIAEQFTRQSRVIDPKKFKAMVAAEVFWKCIRINLGDAEQFLTDKELNSVADTIPAKSNGFVFKIKRVERKSRR